MMTRRSFSPSAHTAQAVPATRPTWLTRSFSALLITQLILGPAVLTAQAAQAPATPQVPPPASPQVAPPTSPPAAPPANMKGGEITEEEVKSLLVGKQLFLRGGYLGESLSFDIHGDPTGSPTRGSYTLSAVQIDKVNLTKHHLELEGVRYAIHFLGDNPYDDPGKDVERVRITPKKKTFRVTIQREQVSKVKKEKDKSPEGQSETGHGHGRRYGSTPARRRLL